MSLLFAISTYLLSETFTLFISSLDLCVFISGDALDVLKRQLNASANQLTDWNVNMVNPCTWNHIICDAQGNVTQV